MNIHTYDSPNNPNNPNNPRPGSSAGSPLTSRSQSHVNLLGSGSIRKLENENENEAGISARERNRRLALKQLDVLSKKQAVLTAELQTAGSKSSNFQRDMFGSSGAGQAEVGIGEVANMLRDFRGVLYDQAKEDAEDYFRVALAELPELCVYTAIKGVQDVKILAPRDPLTVADVNKAQTQAEEVADSLKALAPMLSGGARKAILAEELETLRLATEAQNELLQMTSERNTFIHRLLSDNEAHYYQIHALKASHLLLFREYRGFFESQKIHNERGLTGFALTPATEVLKEAEINKKLKIELRNKLATSY